MTLKVYLERPPYDGRVNFFMANIHPGTDYVDVAVPCEIEYRQQKCDQADFDRRPWLIFEPHQLLSFYESLRSGLQELGLIRSNPSEEEVRSLSTQLLDCQRVRDSLLKAIDNIHRPDASKSSMALHIAKLEADLAITSNQLDEQIRKNR